MSISKLWYFGQYLKTETTDTISCLSDFWTKIQQNNTYNYSLVIKIGKNEKFGSCANAEMCLRSKSKTGYENLLDRIALSQKNLTDTKFFSPKT